MSAKSNDSFKKKTFSSHACKTNKNTKITAEKKYFSSLCNILEKIQFSYFSDLTKKDVHDIFYNVTQQYKDTLGRVLNTKNKDYNMKVIVNDIKTPINDEKIVIGKKVGEGAAGIVYKGYFDMVGKTLDSVVIKENFQGTAHSDAVELLIQTYLYCIARDKKGKKVYIPKPMYAARHKKKRYIVLEPMQSTLEDELMFKENETSEQHFKRIKGYLITICETLKFFQDKCKFVHGDLHVGNIMFKNSIPYVIDFGRSSLVINGNRQHGDQDFLWEYSPSVDLIALYSTIADELEYQGFGDCKTYKFCHKYVDKFYKKVLETPIKSLDKKYLPFRRVYDSGDCELKWHMLVLGEKVFDVVEPDFVPKNALKILKDI